MERAVTTTINGSHHVMGTARLQLAAIPPCISLRGRRTAFGAGCDLRVRERNDVTGRPAIRNSCRAPAKIVRRHSEYEASGLFLVWGRARAVGRRGASRLSRGECIPRALLSVAVFGLGIKNFAKIF